MTPRKEAAFLSETSVIHLHYLVLHGLELIASEIYESNPETAIHFV
jgi:hypothetical protein